MTNKFYAAFDQETLDPRGEDPHRTAFQRDRDRIVHGHPFRRLQGKTQVFLTGEYDFYRTRLTHSIEVAQIGRSICDVLRKNGKPLQDDYYIDPNLVEAACLAHDLGNPPFGHAGQRTLHEVMIDYGGFEGNAQSLKLICEMFYRSMKNKSGMGPTRAFVDGIMKYKVIYDNQKKEPKDKFLYPEQTNYLDFVFKGFDWHSARSALPPSIECQIMERADDIAYSIDDLKDATIAGFLTPRKIKDWMDGQNQLTAKTKDQLAKLIEKIESGDCDSHLSKRMGDFIRAVSLEPMAGFLSDQINRYRFRLSEVEEVKEERKAYADLAFDVVFSSRKIQQLEFKADHVLKKLFYSLLENYEAKTKRHLLPEDWHDYLTTQVTKTEHARTICDFISGMTDAFAGRYFQRFFLPDYGSLTDLV